MYCSRDTQLRISRSTTILYYCILYYTTYTILHILYCAIYIYYTAYTYILHTYTILLILYYIYYTTYTGGSKSKYCNMFWMFYINTNLSIFVIQLFAVKVWAREEYPPPVYSAYSGIEQQYTGHLGAPPDRRIGIIRHIN